MWKATVYELSRAPNHVKLLVTIGLYLLGIVVCGAVMFWGSSDDHQEPL